MLSDDVIALMNRLRAEGTPFCLATVVRVEAPTSGKPGDKALVTADGKLFGWIGGSCSQPSIRREALQVLEYGTPRLVRIGPSLQSGEARVGEVVVGTSCPSGGTIEIFLEPHLSRPELVVIGRSPVAMTLLKLAGLVGFRSCAVHPSATMSDFPDAEVVVDTLDLSGVSEADAWIVVATMGHYDEDALDAALSRSVGKSRVPYIGLVASRRRKEAIFDVLSSRGWDSDALSTIMNPVGDALGDTPEEIALSAMADIVSRRNGRQQRARLGEKNGSAVRTSGEIFATDPVCGMAVEVGSALHRLGDVYFCGPGCLEAYRVAMPRGQPTGA